MMQGEVIDRGVVFEVVWDGNVRDGWEAPKRPKPELVQDWSQEQTFRASDEILRALMTRYFTASELVAHLELPKRTIRSALQRLVGQKRLTVFQKFEARIGKPVALYGRPEHPFPYAIMERPRLIHRRATQQPLFQEAGAA